MLQYPHTEINEIPEIFLKSLIFELSSFPPANDCEGVMILVRGAKRRIIPPDMFRKLFFVAIARPIFAHGSKTESTRLALSPSLDVRRSFYVGPVSPLS